MSDHPLSPPPSGPPPERAAQAESAVRSPGSGPSPAWADDETLDWRRYLSALFRYKWLVIASMLLGAGAAYLSWGQVTTEYVAQGSLWVNSEGGGERGPILTEGLLPASSWVDLLQSYSVIDTVVAEEKLYVQAARPGDQDLFEGFELAEGFQPGAYRLEVSENGRRLMLLRDRIVVDQASLGASIGGAVGLDWTPPAERLAPGQEVPFDVLTPRQAARQLQDRIQAQIDPQRSFIRVELRGADPRKLVSVVDRLMERHVELAAELKRGHLDEQTEVLAEQLRQVEAELADAEGSLESFRVQTITLPSEQPRAVEPGLEMTRGPVFSDYFEMRLQQEQLRRDRQRLENVLENPRDGGFPVEAVELIPAVSGSSELGEALRSLVTARAERRALLERYTPEHPPVREISDRIGQLETNTLPSLMRQLIAQLRQEEESLAQRIDASAGSLSEIPPRAIEEARLRRRVAIAENLYTDLRARYETTSLARRSTIPDVRILDRAVAREIPVSDRRARLAFLLFLGFFGTGIAGALFADRLDSRLRTPDEVAVGMGVPVLGTVPRIRSRNGASPLLQRRTREATEAFRELRTNLTYAYGSAGPIVVTISSTGTGEGKTLVTANLGLSFAQLGRRTLVIDADTRRGDLHHAFGRARKPGLTDYLRAVAAWEDVLQDTDHAQLDFVGSGTHVANSPELLSSALMGRMLSEVRRHYEVILVDSPPFGAGPDPLVLSCITGHLLLVLRSGATHREFTQTKLEPLARVPVRLLGAVLNDFEPGRMSAYHQRYYGTYLPGYEAGSEEPDEEQRKKPVGTGGGS